MKQILIKFGQYESGAEWDEESELGYNWGSLGVWNKNQ